MYPKYGVLESFFLMRGNWLIAYSHSTIQAPTLFPLRSQ